MTEALSGLLRPDDGIPEGRKGVTRTAGAAPWSAAQAGAGAGPHPQADSGRPSGKRSKTRLWAPASWYPCGDTAPQGRDTFHKDASSREHWAEGVGYVDAVLVQICQLAIVHHQCHSCQGP